MKLTTDRHDVTNKQGSTITLWPVLRLAIGWAGLRPRPKYVGLLACWIVCAVTACQAQAITRTATPAATPGPLLSELRIEVLPRGSTVRINGEEKGRTALRLDLPAGQYQVLVEHTGYASLQRDIQLMPGQILVVTETLRDSAAPLVELAELAASVEAGHSMPIHAQATDNEAVTVMRLAVDGRQVTEVYGPSVEYAWDTSDVPVGTYAILVEAQDAAGNVGQAKRTVTVEAGPTPQPSSTREPTATAAPTVKVYETTLTLSAYPYDTYLKERIDPRYNLPIDWLDRAAYEAANPRPQPRSFKAVVLENAYLKLTFLPELGGRLYQCVFKPTGQNIFYQNAVLKPSYWGALSREENWWLAAGGMEWALPVYEHGYEWGMPWVYQIERNSSQASIVLRDSLADDRLQAEVRVTLPTNRAYFVVEPHLINPTAQPVALQFWLNALLTLGAHSTSPNTEFIYPTDRMIVHSTGDSALPGEHQIIPWPVVDGRDLSRYGNWRNWLGVFVPEVQQDYVGAYNHDTGLGVVRIFPHQVARGLKLFAFGAGFAARSEYTDDDSEYFELWGGPCRTFWPEDAVTIQAGESLSWSEVWLPFNDISGLDTANPDVVVRVDVQGGQVRLGIAASSAQSGLLQVQWNGQAFDQEAVQLDPQKPVMLLLPLPSGASVPGQLTLRLTDAGGETLLEYDSMH
jgi:hypothetical protein